MPFVFGCTESKTRICGLGIPHLLNLDSKPNQRCQILSFPASLAVRAWSCYQAPPIRCAPPPLTESWWHRKQRGRPLSWRWTPAAAPHQGPKPPFCCPFPSLVLGAARFSCSAKSARAGAGCPDAGPSAGFMLPRPTSHHTQSSMTSLLR